MEQVKFFYGFGKGVLKTTLDKLENEINNWLKENKEKVELTKQPVYNILKESLIEVTVMLTYREREQKSGKLSTAETLRDEDPRD
ncbi:MAG: hypothetical protein V1928_04190 [Parcubacteria group bacterium]